jgi:hypothetical protein
LTTARIMKIQPPRRINDLPAIFEGNLGLGSRGDRGFSPGLIDLN